MSYHGLGDVQLPASISKKNQELMNQAYDRLEIDAKYAGPISKAEATIIGALWSRGQQGQLPSVEEVGSALKGAAVGVSVAAATGACAPTLGPGAVVCGMAAGAVAGAIADVFVSKSSNCSTRINGVCWSDVMARYLAVANDQMAPGDTKGKAEVKDAVSRVFDLVNKRLYWEQMSWVSGPTNAPWTPMSVVKPPNPTVVQPPGISVFEGLSLADAIIARAALLSRYGAERRFVEGVKASAETAQANYLAWCENASCKSQVKGITLQGAYLAGKALRTPAEGAAAAEMIWEAVSLQDEGVVGNAKTVSDLQLSASRDKAKAKAVEALDKMSVGRAAKAIGLLALIAAAGGGFYYYRKHRRLCRTTVLESGAGAT